MKSCLLFVTLSCLAASAFAVKCFVCTSRTIDRNADDKFKSAPAYRVRSCQKNGTADCNGEAKVITIADYYLGDACATFDAKKLNGSDSKYIVDCSQGCAKIESKVTDRGADVSRTTRQCAFYDAETIGKYLDKPGFKRTGAGSDKVANWFYYCSGDFCNAASGLSQSSAIMIASFYGVLAYLYH